MHNLSLTASLQLVASVQRMIWRSETIPFGLLLIAQINRLVDCYCTTACGSKRFAMKDLTGLLTAETRFGLTRDRETTHLQVLRTLDMCEDGIRPGEKPMSVRKRLF